MRKILILLCIVSLNFVCYGCSFKELSPIDSEIIQVLKINNPEEKIREIHKLELKIASLSDSERERIIYYDDLLKEKDKVVLKIKETVSWGDQFKKDVVCYTLSDLIDFDEIKVLRFGTNWAPSAYVCVENEEYISEVLACLNDIPYLECRKGEVVKIELFEHYIDGGNSFYQIDVVNGGYVEIAFFGFEDGLKYYYSLIKLDDSYKEILSEENIYNYGQYGSLHK